MILKAWSITFPHHSALTPETKGSGAIHKINSKN